MACEFCDNERSGVSLIPDLRRLYDLVAEQRTIEALTMMHEAAPEELPMPRTILRLRQHENAGTDL